MRIVVVALSLAAFVTLGFEWLVVGIGGIGEIIRSGRGENGASAGAAVALLYLIGAAFAVGRPLLSSAVFALGALVGVAAGPWTDYVSLQKWDLVAGALAAYLCSGIWKKAKRAPHQAF